jgi:hypothetical protein
MGKTLMAFVAGVIIYLGAIFFQDGLRTPAIFETMQVDLYPGRRKESYLMKKVENTAVIDRVRHVQTHDM